MEFVTYGQKSPENILNRSFRTGSVYIKDDDDDESLSEFRNSRYPKLALLVMKKASEEELSRLCSSVRFCWSQERAAENVATP